MRGRGREGGREGGRGKGRERGWDVKSKREEGGRVKRGTQKRTDKGVCMQVCEKCEQLCVARTESFSCTRQVQVTS